MSLLHNIIITMYPSLQ